MGDTTAVFPYKAMYIVQWEIQLMPYHIRQFTMGDTTAVTIYNDLRVSKTR